MKYELIGYNVYRTDGSRHFYPKDQFTMIHWDGVRMYRSVYELVEEEESKPAHYWKNLPQYQIHPGAYLQ